VDLKHPLPLVAASMRKPPLSRVFFDRQRKFLIADQLEARCPPKYPLQQKSFLGSVYRKARSPTSGRRSLLQPTSRPKATTVSPCFHSHFLWSPDSLCQMVFSILYRALLSQHRTQLSVWECWLCRDLAVARTRRFASNLCCYGLSRHRSLAIPQRFIDFSTHP